MDGLDAYRALLGKDLRVELRTLRSLPAMALFAVTTFVIFRFGLDRTELEGGLAAGVLVATLLFAAILAINRLFVAEREEGGFELIRLAPARPHGAVRRQGLGAVHLPRACWSWSRSRSSRSSSSTRRGRAGAAGPRAAARQRRARRDGDADLDDRDDVAAPATCWRR